MRHPTLLVNCAFGEMVCDWWELDMNLIRACPGRLHARTYTHRTVARGRKASPRRLGRLIFYPTIPSVHLSLTHVSIPSHFWIDLGKYFPPLVTAISILTLNITLIKSRQNEGMMSG